MSSLRDKPYSQGVAREFTASPHAVLRASRETLLSMGMEIRDLYQIDDRRWGLLAVDERLPPDGDDEDSPVYRALIRIVIEKTSDTQSTARVLTRRDASLYRPNHIRYPSVLLEGIQRRLPE